MVSKSRYLATVALLVAMPLGAKGPGGGEPSMPPASPSAVERIAAGIEAPELRGLIAEVVERNPGLAETREMASAARRRGSRTRALPDPVASLTAFVQSPETRTGPQRFMAGISQGIPGAGKRGLKEEAALLSAAALDARLEAESLMLITEARTLIWELAFLDRYEEITRQLRGHLVQHEEIARSRYSTGIGLVQSVVKVHAEITRVDRELLQVETRRLGLEARLNALRDRPARAPLPRLPLPPVREVAIDPEDLRREALLLRPEIAAADSDLARSEVSIRLAERAFRPDFQVGLVYTLVDPRDDGAGRLQPPQGNGDDVLGLQGGITLPVWRRGRAAGVEEAVHLRAAAEEAKREALAAIEAEIGDLAQRAPLVWRELRLVEDLLIVQAGESLESAQAGYIAGTLNALDLLDAEHVLFDAQTARARVRTDYLIGLAKLEGAVGKALPAAAAPAIKRGES